MKREIGVFLYEQPVRVGRLVFVQEGHREHCTFFYDEAWLRSPGFFALSPMLRTVPGAQPGPPKGAGSVFHDCIADTEPNGWARKVILRDHNRHRVPGGRPLNSLDYLLAVDDASRMGALRFQDESGAFLRQRAPDAAGIPPLLELGQLLAASRAVELNAETQRDLEFLRGRGTSLDGMRPKASVVDGERLYLAKFPSQADERDVVTGEVLALHLARQAGIDVPGFRKIDANGVPVALIERFDRAGGERIPYVSAATLLGADTDPEEHEGSYTQLADVIRQNGDRVREDLAQLWRRLVFNILIRNVDDHLHNHGFLHRGHGKWALAPAFDINPFPDKLHLLKTRISEEAGDAADIDLAWSVAPRFGLVPTQARVILGDVLAATQAWQQAGRALNMNARSLHDFAEAFEHAEKAKAQMILQATRQSHT